MILEKFSGINYGANITGGEGGSNTRVACDTFDGRDYQLTEVDPNGAVLYDRDSGYKRLDCRDLGDRGFQIFLGPNDNPIVEPGEWKSVNVGSRSVVINGTGKRGVCLNEISSTRASSAAESTRYPR